MIDQKGIKNPNFKHGMRRGPDGRASKTYNSWRGARDEGEMRRDRQTFQILSLNKICSRMLCSKGSNRGGPLKRP
jgi:hypothetical protein